MMKPGIKNRKRPLLCFSVLVGARNTAGRKEFSRKHEAMICEITARYFPEGSSILNAEGRWWDPAKRIFIKEESRQILICAISENALRPWCQALSSALQQRELLIVRLGPATLYQRQHAARRAGTRDNFD